MSINPQHLIAQIDKPIYLHFLNRELLSSIINYNSDSDSIKNNILMDVRLTLLMGYRHCYLSPSLIFEDRFARIVLNQFPNLFQKGHIRLSSNYFNTNEFIYWKKEQYYHATDLYSFYFDDTWKTIEDHGLIYLSKDTDTSIILVDQIKNKFNDKSNNDQLLINLKLTSDISKIDLFKPYASEVIDNRGNAALTGLLFNKEFNKHNLKELERKYFNLTIVEQYIKSYLLDFNGVITTNLLSGINHFNYLATEFPFYDISLWQYIYDRLGCIDFIGKCSDIEIISIREEPIYKKFIDTIRICISEAVKSIRIDETKVSNSAYIERIKSQITGHFSSVNSLNKSENIDDFLENLNLATETLESYGLKIELPLLNNNYNFDSALNNKDFPINNHPNDIIYFNTIIMNEGIINMNQENYNEKVNQSFNVTTGDVGGDFNIKDSAIMSEKSEISNKINNISEPIKESQSEKNNYIKKFVIYGIPVLALLSFPFSGLLIPEARKLLNLDSPPEINKEIQKHKE